MSSQLRNICFVILSVLFSGTLSAQTVFYEDFSNNGFDNWTPEGDGMDNWAAIPTVFAGGEEPEVVMYGGPVFSGENRFISPVINTADYTELNLSFLHFVNAGTGGYWLSVETTSDGGTTWNQVWELYHDSNINVNETVNINIENADIGSENFQFCFKFREDSELINGWVFDNITLSSGAINLNVGANEILGLETEIYENEELQISALIENFGAEAASFDTKLEIWNGLDLIYETTETLTDLQPGEEQQVDFDAWTTSEGVNYTAVVTTLLEGDENQGNDAVVELFNVFPTDWYCLPSADCSYGDGLDFFSFAGIENSGSGCSNGGYGVFTEMTANVTAGGTYTATMTTGWINQQVSIWVDFNADFEFTSDELILTDHVLSTSGEMHEVDITMPVNIPTASTTMRVGVNFEANSSPDPCASFPYGEWEDYSIEVTGISGTNEVTFHITEPGGANYEGAEINFYAMTGTTDAQGEYTFTGIADGTFSYIISSENAAFYDVQGEVTVESPNTTVEVELLPNTDVAKNIVVIEEWTGTWCADCPAASNGLEEVEAAGFDVGIIAYHNTDNYTTGNDIPRMQSFYSRGWLPSVAFNGTFAPNCDGPATESCFDMYEPFILEQQEISSPFDVELMDVLLEGDELTVKAKVSYPGFTYAEDVRLLVVVTESGIEEEWLGLTHLNYVERGMYPDVNGTTIDLEQNEEVTIDFTIPVDASWNPENMEIVAFVQDFGSQHIFNGAKSALVATSLDDLKGTRNLTISPNPASDFVNIRSEEALLSIKVVNNIGQVVHTVSIDQADYQLNVSDFYPGFYIIEVETENGTAVKRIVIQ